MATRRSPSGWRAAPLVHRGRLRCTWRVRAGGARPRAARRGGRATRWAGARLCGPVVAAAVGAGGRLRHRGPRRLEARSPSGSARRLAERIRARSRCRIGGLREPGRDRPHQHPARHPPRHAARRRGPRRPRRTCCWSTANGRAGPRLSAAADRQGRRALGARSPRPRSWPRSRGTRMMRGVRRASIQATAGRRTWDTRAKDHRDAIRRLGPSAIHRRSFHGIMQRWLF